MKWRYLSLALLAALGAMGAVAAATDPTSDFDAGLEGFQEVPAVSTTGTGTFRAELDDTMTMLTYELTYSGLEGTATAAHIHLGQEGVAGGVIAFLCGGGGKPACPASSGTVTGTIVAADVIGPTAQGIAAGEFAEVLTALEEEVVYANVHSDKHSGGEIRGHLE